MSANPVVQVGEDEFLLYNPFTKVVDVVDREVVEGLSTPGVLPGDVLTYLKRHGHITDESEADLEQKAFREYEDAYSRFSANPLYYLIPTYNCNMRCIYCYEKDLRREKKVMDEKTLESFFKIVEKGSGNTVLLYGGEPLQEMTRPFIKKVAARCDELGLHLAVCTNGLDLKTFDGLLHQFSTIMITLDGCGPVQNSRRPAAGNRPSFDTVVESIEHVIELDIPLTISVNADAQNIGGLPDFADFIISKGWHTLKNVDIVVSHIMQSLDKKYPYIIGPKEAAQKMVELYEEFPHMEVFLPSIKGSNPLVNAFFKGEEWRPKYWYCGANCYFSFYDPYGYIYPCYMVVGRPQFAIGRFHETLEYFPHRKTWRERSCFSIPECRSCDFSYFCGGGCAYRQYLRTGSFSDPYCDCLEGIVESYVPFLYKKMKEKGRL
jgi:uncharacterized protein